MEHLKNILWTEGNELILVLLSLLALLGTDAGLVLVLSCLNGELGMRSRIRKLTVGTVLLLTSVGLIFSLMLQCPTCGVRTTSTRCPSCGTNIHETATQNDSAIGPSVEYFIDSNGNCQVIFIPQ